MAITFNLDEYVSDFIAAGADKNDVHGLAMGIADIVCAQGYYDPQGDGEFDLLVKEIEDQLPYYL